MHGTQPTSRTTGDTTGDGDASGAREPRRPTPIPPGHLAASRIPTPRDVEMRRIQRLMDENPDGTRRLVEDLMGRGRLGLHARPVADAAAALDAAVDERVDALAGVGIPVAAGDVTVIHREPVTPKRGRHLASTLAFLAAAAVVLGIAPGGAPAAQAAVIPVTRPIVVTASGPTARVAVDVVSTAPMFRSGGHGVIVRAGGATLYGTAASSAPGPQLVRVSGVVSSAVLTPGTTTATVTDIGDYRSTTVPITVLRQSRVAIDQVTPLPGGVLVTGRAMHYDLPTGVYRGDLVSPVQVQQWVAGGRWMTVQTVTTVGSDGSVAALVPGAGRMVVRLVRPAGATVTGGASGWRAAVALPTAPARGGWPVR